MSLVWVPRKQGAMAQLTDDGCYSVCLIVTRHGETYEAWRTRAHIDGPHCIAVGLESHREAREICEHDHAAAG